MNRGFENENWSWSFSCDSVLFLKRGSIGYSMFTVPIWNLGLHLLYCNTQVFVLQSFFGQSQKAIGLPRQTLRVLQDSAVNTDLGRSTQVSSGLFLGVISIWLSVCIWSKLWRSVPFTEQAWRLKISTFCFRRVKSFPNGNSGALNKPEAQRGWR